tara:strand:- start:220 stop:360 length:141 start_codon:yes stop_codon:yes gene_type:complete
MCPFRASCAKVVEGVKYGEEVKLPEWAKTFWAISDEREAAKTKRET